MKSLRKTRALPFKLVTTQYIHFETAVDQEALMQTNIQKQGGNICRTLYHLKVDRIMESPHSRIDYPSKIYTDK